MKTPLDTQTDTTAHPEAWYRGMERIRALPEYRRRLIAPELVEEALFGETEVIS